MEGTAVGQGDGHRGDQILTAVYTLIAVVALAAIAILNELPKNK